MIINLLAMDPVMSSAQMIMITWSEVTWAWYELTAVNFDLLNKYVNSISRTERRGNACG